MSVKHLTPALVGRTIHVIDSSGLLDLACPPRPPGTRGRIGNIRDNTRLLFIGMHLCTRLGHETTLTSIHEVLTQALPRSTQWELGVLRPPTTTQRTTATPFDPDAPTLAKNGKPRKRIWAAEGVEEIGYDDLANAANALRKRLDYGHGSAPNLDDAERAARRRTVEQIIDALLEVTTTARTGTTYAIDATGQWAWTRGPSTQKKKLEKNLTHPHPVTDAADRADTDAADTDTTDPDTLEVTDITIDEDGATAPEDQGAPPPASARGRCLDAAWGYKTSKSGEKEVGFGFHQHTICRVTDPTANDDDEPILIDGFVLTPANADVVDASLGLIDRIQRRHQMTRLVGDMLYTNLKGGRWAIPLAQRGIDQGLAMRTDNHKIVDINGAQMQHGWLHCAAAPMDLRPIPPERANPAEWETYHDEVEEFQRNWAFDRKESGLGRSLTSKWVCPARAGRVNCHAAGTAHVQAATQLGLPVVTPPEDHTTRRACTNKTMDFTPNPNNPHHQRKLMQREYYGSRRWRRLFKRRALVEGVFGILKNASRQRLRRGQNRLPGLAMASIVAAVKASAFNEEQLRNWHDRTGRGPANHPLLQPDPPHWGFRDLTKEDAKTIDAEHLHQLRRAHLQPIPHAA